MTNKVGFSDGYDRTNTARQVLCRAFGIYEAEILAWGKTAKGYEAEMCAEHKREMDAAWNAMMAAIQIKAVAS